MTKQRTASRDYSGEILSGMTPAELVAERRSWLQAMPNERITALYIADAIELIEAELRTR